MRAIINLMSRGLIIEGLLSFIYLSYMNDTCIKQLILIDIYESQLFFINVMSFLEECFGVNVDGGGTFCIIINKSRP